MLSLSNIKTLSLMVQKLWPGLKFFPQIERSQTGQNLYASKTFWAIQFIRQIFGS